MTNPEPTVQELFDLTGKVALVTGASGYLGGALARALAEAGAAVVVSSRDQTRAEQCARSLPGSAEHHAVVIDQIDPGSIERGFAAALAATGKLDVLVNNGHHPGAKDLTEVDFDQFAEQTSNAAGYFLLARRLRDHAVERQAPASIVIIGSMYGQVGSYPDAYEGVCSASPVAYHTLKGGLIQMTRHLAVYWAKDDVRVNCLSPGPFPAERAPEEMVRRLVQKSPMRRMGVPHELKGAIVFLASDAASYMTGQNLTIDGGWTAW